MSQLTLTHVASFAERSTDFENFSNAQRLEGERSAQAQMQATASLTAEMLRSAAESREALERVVSVVAGAATSLSSAASAPQTPASQTPRPRAVKIDAPKFDGADGDKLIHWLLAVERCAKAQLIDSNEQMVSYAISNLRGRASEWAFSTLLADECAFDTWDVFRARITAMYQPPNNEVLLQGRFFSLRQGKLSLERYIQEMRSLCAAITTSPLPESVKVPAFLNGLNSGPARQELYRRLPATMEDAIRIALAEQQSFRVSRPDWNAGHHNGAHHSHRAVTNERRFHGPTPMDLSSAEVTCFNCGKRGHYQSKCPAPRQSAPRTGNQARDYQTPRGNHAHRGYEKKMTVLVDCGASQNFVSKAALEQSLQAYERLVHSGKREKMISNSLSVFATLSAKKHVDTGAQVCGSRAPEPAPASDSDSTGVHASASSYHPDGAVLELRTARSRVRINRRGRRKLSARERDSALASVAEETAASHMIAPSLNAAATSLRAFDRTSNPSIDRAHVDVALRRAKRSPEANASDEVFFAEFAALHELPSTAEAIVSLEEMSYELFLTDLERDQIREIVVPTAFTRSKLCTSSTADESVLEPDKQKRFAAQDWDAGKGSPYFDLLWEFKDVFPDKVPSALPVGRGVRHEIDLEPGSKYCVTRQWPLPREQVEAIDEFFAKRALAGHYMRATFCTDQHREHSRCDDLSEQFTFQLAMKRPSDQVNREERPSSKRQRTAPELFDISPILKKKGELEFYKERFFSWRRINGRDDPNQHIAAQRDSWRTFVRLENENKMEHLLRRGNARAERRTPADDRANRSSGRRSVAPGDATSSSHSCGPRREHQTPMSDEVPTCPSSVDIHATELCRSVDGSTASFLDDESVGLHDQQSTEPPSDALPESLTTGVGLNEKTIERLWKWKSAHRGQIEALQQRCSTLEERCESLENLVADHESKIDDLTEGSAQCSALESRFEERFQQVQDEPVRLQKNEKSRELAHDRLLRSVEEVDSALEVLRGEHHSRLQALEAVKDQSFDVLQLLYAEKNLQSDELFAFRNQVERLHDQLDRLRKIS
ncbi:Gag protein, partial [Globisporangium splendens]